MSQAIEDSIELFHVKCADVGLDCKCIIYGINEEKVIDNTILHMFDCHAIKPEEMTVCMKLKIKENIRSSYS
jgi:predicted small metal-binding protein